MIVRCSYFVILFVTIGFISYDIHRFRSGHFSDQYEAQAILHQCHNFTSYQGMNYVNVCDPDGLIEDQNKKSIQKTVDQIESYYHSTKNVNNKLSIALVIKEKVNGTFHRLSSSYANYYCLF